jgi:hypothetical protein
MRECSQGLGVDLSNGRVIIARAEAERNASTVTKPAFGIAPPDRLAKEHDAHRDPDKRDHGGNGARADAAADESHS